MPPRGHSGGSHRSSHHSSHSYSSHRSSSFGGHSSHRSSSYRGSSYRGSYHSHHSSGSSGSIGDFLGLFSYAFGYKGASDYSYGENLETPKEDYNYYPGLKLLDGTNGTNKIVDSEMLFVCEYCNTEIKAAWNEGQKPLCPNCNAQMTEGCFVEDELVRNDFDKYYSSDATKRYRKLLKIFETTKTITLIVVMFMVIAVATAVYQSHITNRNQTISSSNTENNQDKDSLYIEALGRTCYWVNEYESYYDPVTDCYFWYNNKIDHPDWQYWYEGISSKYDGYGWMEYDYIEEQWYIETSNGKWEKLSENIAKSNTIRLWHM